MKVPLQAWTQTLAHDTIYMCTCGYICSQLMIASYIEIFYFRSKSLQVINRAMKCF